MRLTHLSNNKDQPIYQKRACSTVLNTLVCFFLLMINSKGQQEDFSNKDPVFFNERHSSEKEEIHANPEEMIAISEDAPPIRLDRFTKQRELNP